MAVFDNVNINNCLIVQLWVLFMFSKRDLN